MAKTQQDNLLPILGIGIAGYGAYLLYKKKKEEEAPPVTPPNEEPEEPPYIPPESEEPIDPTKPQPTDYFPVTITDPTQNEKWSVLLPHTINVNIENPYTTKKKKIWITLTMVSNETGQVIEWTEQNITINAGSIKKEWWLLTQLDIAKYQMMGWYTLYAEVFDLNSMYDYRTKLGGDQVAFELAWFG